MKYSVFLKCLGEFRMGVNGFGIIIKYKDKLIDLLGEKIVFANSDEPDIGQLIDEIKGESIIVIKGEFSSFLVNLEKEEVSLFMHTIRTSDGIWSEESPIYGSEVNHFNGKSGRQYYVQFPFVPFNRFFEEIKNYEKMRIEQIKEARTAT